MSTLRERMMRFDWSLLSIIKVTVALVVITIALSIVLGVAGMAVRAVFGVHPLSLGGTNIMPTMMEDALSYRVQGGARESRSVSKDVAMVADSSVLPPATNEGGAFAEDYEHRNYSAQYETRGFEKTCGAVEDLKPLEYVVFDSSNKNEDRCNYTFRVEVAHEAEVAAILKALHPRDFSTNAYTVERSIENSESEIAMLERRLASTSHTLTQAESAFNDLISQATREGDTATLSEVINNKVSTLDRLNRQLLSTQDQLDRFNKNLGQQTDQVEYANFNVSVSRMQFVDGQSLGDMWKSRVQELVVQVNSTLLALTVGLLALALGALQFVIFGAIVIIAGALFMRVMWIMVKHIWKWSPQSRV